MIELGFQDTYFQDIKDGKKTVIGKIDADLKGIKKGDTVIFFKDVGNKSNSSEKISVKVKDIHKFNDVPTMLMALSAAVMTADGKVLKAELDFLLGRYDGISFQDANYQKYGLGATEVYIKHQVK